jgi:hypothetical protein
MEEVLLMDVQRQWFPEMETSPGIDTVNSIEMTMKYSEYCIKLVAGFDRSTSILKQVLLRLKCYQTASHDIKKPFVKKTTDVANLTVVLV